jgi:hypothetical protein
MEGGKVMGGEAEGGSAAAKTSVFDALLLLFGNFKFTKAYR